MNKNVKGAVAVAGVAAIALIVWRLTKKKPQSDEEIIISNGHYLSGIDMMNKTFGKDFLSVWAKASKAKSPNFIFNGKEYSTQGGKAL